MATIFFKWFLVLSLLAPKSVADNHPIFVSVTEIEYNATDKTLEISCKIFTDDFEKTLRQTYKGKIDLLDAKYKTQMSAIISDYIGRHLSVKANDKPGKLEFVGFEQEEEGITSYFQVSNVASVKKIEITDNILYEYKKEQISLLHVIVKGERKSTKLLNPDDKASFNF